MNFLRHHTLRFTTLSPVHIGSDETYEPTNYVIDEDALYEFDGHSAATALTENDRQQLLTLVNGKPSDQMLKEVQSFFYQRRHALIASARHSLPVGEGIAQIYRQRIGKTAQQESSGKQVINRLEIDRTAYNPMDRRPIFPGSSIKGAIRTALLDLINSGEPLKKVREFDKRRNKDIVRDEINRDLQQRLFKYTMRDLHKDPMRLVKLGDARWYANDSLPGSEIRFAVNRKKQPVEINGRLLQTLAEKKGPPQLLECVPPMRPRCLEGSLTIHLTDAAQNQRDKLPAEELRWDMVDIAHACNRFYLPMFEKETLLLQQRGYVDPNWCQAMQKLITNTMQRLNEGKAFLLRLGRHSGAEAVTLNGVRSIKIMEGKDPETGRQRFSFSKEGAKTVWLAGNGKDSKTGMLPFGWLLVEVDPPSELTPELDALHEFSISTVQSWVELQSQRREQLLMAEKEKLALLSRQKEEEHRRQLEEEERQQRLASLSPVERELEEFLDSFPGDNPATELFNQLQNGKWEVAEDQQAIARKIRELWEQENKWIPDFSGSNKKKCKQRDRCKKLLLFFAE